MAAGRGEVLVTGAAGFIGSHIAAACHRSGWTVTGLDIRPGAPGGGCQHWATGTAGDPVVLREIRGGRYRAVVHQAAITSTLETDEALLNDVNVGQALAVADACAAGQATFVYASSHSVYGKAHVRVPLAEEAAADRAVCTGPLNLYAQSKLDLDNAMTTRHNGSLHWTGLRYTNVFGPGEQHKGKMASIISQLLRRTACGEPLTLFDDTLEACRDYVPVASVAATVAVLLEQQVPAGVYNLGSGIPVSFATIVEWCASLAGAYPEINFRPNPMAAQYQYWTCADMTKLETLLADFQRLTLAEVRSAAGRLYHCFGDSEFATDSQEGNRA
jgi:ADP-L-glycero-D-manno-heptose 6-epimerase